MSLIQWKKEYAIGIAKLDKQHKKILKILNQVIERQTMQGDEREIGSILDNLQDYSKVHFRAEEEYMLKHRFPGYEEQRNEHNQFIDRLLEAQREYLKHGQLTSVNLFNFVWDWFSQHILKLDKKLSDLG